MSIAVLCPRCQATFGITDDLANGAVCCPKCANVFSRSALAGIQAGAPPTASKPAAARNDREDDEPIPSRPHAPPRVPFPTAPLLILVCGILFLLLALSAGFNLWIIANPDLRFDREQQAVIAEQQAQVARMQAVQEAERAAVNQQRAQQDEAKLKRDIDDLRRELVAVQQQLDEARRKLEKEN
jgi:predicted Zn finger-like uncharacterized protein